MTRVMTVSVRVMTEVMTVRKVTSKVTLEMTPCEVAFQVKKHRRGNIN